MIRNGVAPRVHHPHNCQGVQLELSQQGGFDSTPCVRIKVHKLVGGHKRLLLPSLVPILTEQSKQVSEAAMKVLIIIQMLDKDKGESGVKWPSGGMNVTSRSRCNDALIKFHLGWTLYVKLT